MSANRQATSKDILHTESVENEEKTRKTSSKGYEKIAGFLKDAVRNKSTISILEKKYRLDRNIPEICMYYISFQHLP